MNKQNNSIQYILEIKLQPAIYIEVCFWCNHNHDCVVSVMVFRFWCMDQYPGQWAMNNIQQPSFLFEILQIHVPHVSVYFILFYFNVLYQKINCFLKSFNKCHTFLRIPPGVTR